MEIGKVEIKKAKTVKELMDELQLPDVPYLIEMNGEIFYPQDVRDEMLLVGQNVTFIPVVAGG